MFSVYKGIFLFQLPPCIFQPQISTPSSLCPAAAARERSELRDTLLLLLLRTLARLRLPLLGVLDKSVVFPTKTHRFPASRSSPSCPPATSEEEEGEAESDLFRVFFPSSTLRSTNQDTGHRSSRSEKLVRFCWPDMTRSFRR